MKKICVISDTHHNLEYQDLVLAQITDIDFVIHLGDFYDDSEALINNGYEVIRIPGVWCPDYSNEAVENRKIFTIDRWRFFISHTPISHEYDLANDLKPEKVLASNSIDIFLYGHTHIPEIKKENGIIVCNPGHLKSLWEKGYSPSFALISIDECELKIEIIDLFEKKVVQQEVFKYQN
ncbi:MAG: YfcE family phosphodiesterase [Candidatus Margulisiibacteriota bacterium]|jgi:hypothetical protein